MSSMSGPGLPGGSISNGPRGQSVGGLLSGTGMNPGFDQMHTARVTSTVDPVANPRGTIHTQYVRIKRISRAVCLNRMLTELLLL